MSVFDFFGIGIGPSSSHTTGPMRAANRFVDQIHRVGVAAGVVSIRVELFGSLALTGKGHGTDKAIFLGLQGETPEGVDPENVAAQVDKIRRNREIRLPLDNGRIVKFCESESLLFCRNEQLPFHPNGIRFIAFGREGRELLKCVYYSVGGGFVVSEQETVGDRDPEEECVRFPFVSAADLLDIAVSRGFSISEIVRMNEEKWHSRDEVNMRALAIWKVMRECVDRGCAAEGNLPGGLGVRRRAPKLYQSLRARAEEYGDDPLFALEWVNLFALAVSEENAAGGRVVTAPTNGAAGIIPAVLSYYTRFCKGTCEEGIIRFLLTAGAIASLYKRNASISGAEVGCQGEIGVACSMAAAGLTEALGGSVHQVEQAAEIGMEHNLGLTCDPIMGLVQIPCIERNAMGAVKAINASRLALGGDGQHYVSLDRVIAVMKQTGLDMSSQYKETSRGGLAVSLPNC